MIRLLLVLVSSVSSISSFPSGSPLYQYKYQTEDVLKTAASNVPLRGYHVMEGGYYPSEGRGYIAPSPQYTGQFLAPLGHQFLLPQYSLGGFLGGGTGLAQGGLVQGGLGQGGLGHYPQVGQLGGAVGHYPHKIGGEEISKEEFSGGKKNLNEEKYERSEGKKGEESSEGKAGYAKGEAAAKDVQGEAGYYSNADGEKKIVEDGKEYQGGQKYQKEGKSGEEETTKKGHKKGHKIKSFKTSHHKDESGKSEEYYDEEHDEGGNTAFNGQTGSFGENAASSFKGGKEDSKFNSAEAKKEGHFKKEHSIGKAEGDEGKYAEKKFAGNEATFARKNGADEQSLLGHQESSKFIKSQPFVIPFYQP
ncbi:unnamed protein product [Phyllotreta striolata]|uniref:Uncharacterized protein n=1 Tax=Phyllotreta striolata TaxID=444603 RepID=A0A9N9TRL6_PHYSR|nr:unnamed protein product [Phyllotreta striolata]